MKRKNSVKICAAALCLFMAVSCLAVGLVAKAGEKLISDMPGEVVVAEADGVYSAAGTMERGRSGFAIAMPINTGHELKFDFKMLVDSGEELLQGGAQNRGYVLTLNEYPSDSATYNGHISGTTNGLQIEIRTNYSLDISVGVMHKGQRGEAVILSKTENKYFYSALYQKAYEGVTADNNLVFSMFPSDANGNQTDRRHSTHYTIVLGAKNTSGKVVDTVSFQVDKTKITGTSDYTVSPYLGMYVINEPNVTKEIQINAEISNIDNGLVKEMTLKASAPKQLGQGVPQKIEVECVPFEEGVDLSGVTYQYYSSAPEIISVSEEGIVSAVAESGIATIGVLSSEGNYAELEFYVEDTEKPVITIDDSISVPTEVTQYETIVLPNFEVSDNSGHVTKYARVTAPKYAELDCDDSLKSLSYVPTEAGQLTIEYGAVDLSGNTSSQILTINVLSAGEIEDWIKFGTYYSSGILTVDENEKATISGSVTPKDGEAGRAGMYYANPLIFLKNEDGSYDKISFDLNIRYGQGHPTNINNDSERNRGFYIAIAEASSTGKISDDKFAWNNIGIQLFLGKRYSGYDNLNGLMWYELRAGMAQLSRQHTSVIDRDKGQREGNYSQGGRYMPWHKDGSITPVANKVVTGETIHCTIEYYDSETPGWDGTWNENYYVMSLDGWQLRIPAKTASGKADGFEREVYLGFVQYTSDGDIPYNFSVSNVENGEVRKVFFEGGNSRVCRYRDTFTLQPKLLLNDGITAEDTFTFVSYNEKVATVNEKGEVEIAGIGETSIKATSNSTGKAGLLKISVEIDTLKFENNEIIMYLDEEMELPIVAEPARPLEMSLSSTDNFTVAALKDGTIQAVAVGEAEVTVSYGDHADTCVVKVIEGTREVNDENSGGSTDKTNLSPVIAGIIAALLVVAGTAASVFVIHKRKNTRNEENTDDAGNEENMDSRE